MTVELLVPFELKAEFLPAAAAWADGLTVKMPARLAALLADGAYIKPEDELRILARGEAIALRDRRAFLAFPPRAAKLPISYRTVPSPLRRLLANGLGRVQRLRQTSWAEFPGWPLDLSADLVADLSQSKPPTRQKTPVILTHDIDSPEGLINLVEKFLPIEEAAGARSANYFVPCAWPLDHGLIAEVANRGHEVGVHGFDHSNKTSFAEPEERARRIKAGTTFGSRYNATGYRAPSLVRSRELLADLAPHYSYDSSVPTSGGPFPVPNNGSASARPWRVGTLWELPLSMPRDGSLRFLGHSAPQIEKIWRDCASRIANSGGTVILLTHCERGFSGNSEMLAAYRSFLDFITSCESFEFTLPRDLISRLT